MDDQSLKNKQKIQNVINEINNLKKYTNELANNISGEKLEEYCNKITKDIVKAQDKVEELYTKKFE